ncbi:MAG: hypothetical protein NUW22_12495 [Acidobacteria bacterium]|nr:hypothetical protein [Acidobacteriota bacterium]
MATNKRVPCACGRGLKGADRPSCRLCWTERGADLKKPPKLCRLCQSRPVNPRSRQGKGFCRTCFDTRRMDCVEAIASGPPDTSAGIPSASMTVHGDAAEVSRTTQVHVRTLADLVRVCEIDTDEWIIERWVANKWEVGTKAPDGTVSTTPLFQVKAWLKRNAPIIETKAILADLVADAKKQIAPRPAVTRQPSGPHMLEISIPDLHLGKLAWAPETGGANYDSKIAADLFLKALDALIARTAAFKFERVVFPAGNDFFHADTKQGTTTSGTPLDTDSRFHKTFLLGRRLMADAIERLRPIAPVTVVIVPGNHDALSAFHLGDSLACLYHNTPDVTVMNDPIPRKYVHYGQSLLLYTHSDKGKRSSLPLLMATERPREFGASQFREAHVGHTHEFKVQELMGVRVRVSPALCSADAWHSENHFVGNLRSAEALVWSRDEGNVAVATYTVPEKREKVA